MAMTQFLRKKIHSFTEQQNLGTLAQIFRTHVQKLMQLLKKGQRQNPWFFLIGSDGAGKTTWLKKASFSSMQIISSSDEGTQICATDDAVFFDFPGIYLSEHFRLMWPKMARIFKQLRFQRAKGILLFINLYEFLNQTTEEQDLFLQSLKYILQQLSTFTQQTLPISIILTHMDCLYGFNEFFNHLDEVGRQQPFGFSIPVIADEKNRLEYVETEFLRLVHQLHQQVVSYLHRERNIKNRALIKDFPLQFETIKTPLLLLIGALFDLTNILKRKNYRLAGLYFSSAQPAQPKLDRLSRPITQNIELNLPSPTPSAFVKNKSFFIQSVLTQIKQEAKYITAPEEQPNRFIVAFSYTTVVSLVALGIIWMTHTFNRDMSRLNQAEKALQKYQFIAQQEETSQHLSTQTLVAFDTLAKSIQLLDSQRFLRKKASSAYAQALQNQFLPQVAKYLEQKIQSKVNAPSGELYNWLKIYLMLGNLGRRDVKQIKQTLAQSWKKELGLNTQEIQQLNTYLEEALQTQTLPIPLNLEIIGQARQTLNTLPYALLAYLILKNQTEHERIDPLMVKTDGKHNLVMAAENNFSIPRIYTKALFVEIYEKTIPAMSKTVVAGDWVLGKKPNDRELVSPNELIEQVRSFYLADYVNWWNLSLIKAELIHFQSLHQAESALNLLSDNDSPLKQLLTVIAQNTAMMDELNSTTETFNKTIAQKFESINAVFDMNKQGHSKLEQIQQELKQLKNYLHGITQADNIEVASFLAAKSRFTEITTEDPFNRLDQIAQETPEPMKDWIHAITQSCWQLVLKETEHHLEHEWQRTVYPEYKRNLEGRYPFVRQASQEVRLEDFTHFLGPQGTLARYDQQLLSPFIDSTQQQWHVKTLNGLSLNISDATLAQFERASIIRQMFFADDPKQVAIQFSLQPVSFEPIVKKMTLTINGQLLEDHQGENTISNFTWPGPRQKPGLAQLEFSNIDGQYATMTTDGEWALFRLFDRSGVQAETDTRLYQIIFDLNGNAARYQLAAKNSINPFIPNILDQFRAPSSIHAENTNTQAVATTRAGP